MFSDLEDEIDDVIDSALASFGQLDSDDEEGATSRQNFRTRNLK